MKIIIAIGGSSGSLYAKRILDKLMLFPQIDTAVIHTENALINWDLEIKHKKISDYPFIIYNQKDFFAPAASGSAKIGTMIVCPCSMGLLARISQGISNDLITRAADVMLKERRKLILVPRETPYNLIHLKNMTLLSEAGAIICPASPSFYNNPKTIVDAIDTVVDRVLDLAEVPIQTFRWGNKYN